MDYTEILEKLVLSNKLSNNYSYLMNEFPYQNQYEPFNLDIIAAAKNGKKSISFDFVNDSDELIASKKYPEVIWECRRIYPLDKGTAAMNMFHYPKYLAARGFKIEITESQERHGYNSLAYSISW